MKPKLSSRGRELLPSFVKFSKHLIDSQDIDPLYNVLGGLQGARTLNLEQRLWHTFLYVAWYNLPSAEAAFEKEPMPSRRLMEELDPKWPTGIERRNHRGGNVKIHIASYLHAVEKAGWQEDWWHQPIKKKGNPKDNWRRMFEHVQTLSGNGRWAAYKHCEILMKVLGFPMEPPDMGNQFSSGPRQGLDILFREEGEELTDSPEDVKQADLEGEYLKRGLEKALGHSVGIEQVETILCNFKSLYKGRYYVGHDIDELQEQIIKARVAGWLSPSAEGALWKARRLTLPRHYLGEFEGWEGVDKKRMSAFKRTGKILVRKRRGR